MSRVAWPVLGGGEVETLLSNLIDNWSGKSLRIRPSKGDYGIDVIIPSSEDPNRWDVYQIKKFAQNLSANQKGQVEKSFGRALIRISRRPPCSPSRRRSCWPGQGQADGFGSVQRG